MLALCALVKRGYYLSGVGIEPRVTAPTRYAYAG
jgi:hypothetical protein